MGTFGSRAHVHIRADCKLLVFIDSSMKKDLTGFLVTVKVTILNSDVKAE